MKKFVKITPEKFKEAFMKIIGKHNHTLVRFWRHDKKYTKHFEKVYKDIARKLNLECVNESYKFDAQLYAEKDKRFKKGTTYPKYLSVVIEHENQQKTEALVEMNKLSFLNTPLKVLISYPCEEYKEEFLKTYEGMCKDADIFNDFSTKRKQLLIFGPYKPKKRLKWSFYVYKNGKFIEMNKK